MMREFGKFTFGIILGLLFVFVAWRLWFWFAVPLGAPALSYLQATGLYTLAASVMLWGFYAPVKNADPDDAFLLCIGKAVLALILLFEGWIIHICLVGMQ